MHCHRAGFFPRLVPPVLLMLLVAAAALASAESLAADATGGSRRILVCGGRTAIVDITSDHPEGVVEWSWPASTREGWVLPDGAILAGLTNGNRVVEYGNDGKPRWEVTAADVDAAINDACGIQRLPSGNTMIASYRIGKDGVRLVEVSPEKKAVWKWQANVPNVHHFQVLAVDGVAVPWPPLR